MQAQLRSHLDVSLPVVVGVAGDVSGIVVQDHAAWVMGVVIPNTLAFICSKNIYSEVKILL